MQLLHCVKQAGVGGDNLFADGFRVAADMRRDHRDSFELLAATPVHFIDVGTEGREFRMKSRATTFE